MDSIYGFVPGENRMVSRIDHGCALFPGGRDERTAAKVNIFIADAENRFRGNWRERLSVRKNTLQDGHFLFLSIFIETIK